MATAVPLITHSAKGRAVLLARRPLPPPAAGAGPVPQTLLFGGDSVALGDDAHDEELHVEGTM